MLRGIPISIGVHVFALAVLLFYGHWVPTPQVKEPRLIRVSMVQLPKPAPPAPPVVQPQPQPVEPRPEPKPAPPPEPKPAQVPKKQPQQEVRKPDAPPPEPKPQRREPERPAEPAPEPVSMATVMDQGAQVASTDEPFPHDWYLELVRQRVMRVWNPAQVAGGVHFTAVHFFIERSGQVVRPTILRSCGIGLLDREALRAVQSVQQLPPLPREFGGRSLGVTFEFVAKPGP